MMIIIMDTVSDNRIAKLKELAIDIRIQCMEQFKAIGVGHVGGCMSVVELMACLYGEIMRVDPKNPRMESRDRIILSKGHAGPAMYAALALKGFFGLEALATLNQLGTMLPSHTDRNRTPGVDMTTGSLGQGFSSGLGIALGCKLKGLDNYTYIILGDGECEEGQVWESAMFAAAKHLDHVVAFVDANKYQIDGSTSEVLDPGDIGGKFAAFGWHVSEVENGHDVEEICAAIHNARQDDTAPKAIILNTVKGYGCAAALSRNIPTNHNMNISKQVADETIAALLQEKGLLK